MTVTQKSLTVERARRMGWNAAHARDASNPFEEETQGEFHAAWEEGREDAEDQASDSFACSMDSSMRDTHGEDC